MKKIIITALLIAFCAPSYALNYETLNSVKEPAYRTGLSDDPEKNI